MASANKMCRLKYSCEEVYERMDKGLCIFCEELDSPGHHQLKHKGVRIVITECDDDQVSEDEEEAHQGTVKNPKPFIETMTNVEPETMKKSDPFIEPLKHASALQVPDSVYDVLPFHQMDSLVKEVGELPHQSTSGKHEKVAHQLFDEMPSKEKRIKHLKGWRFKFKPTSKRSRLMDDKFSFVEATDSLNKDPQEIIWDCVNKEFKEIMAACGKKRIDQFMIVDETLKPAVYDGTNQIRVWDCGGSPLECADESYCDGKSSEVTVEGISNKPVNMIQDGESNSDNESRSEVTVSQFQVPLSSMEPSRRCRNVSLDVVDERMCNELVCEEDGDSIIIMSAKFGETYEDPRFELVCLKQSHDPVENHLDNIESALTRSSLRHTPTYQYRAPFNPYQNCNDHCHYKREFGNYTELGIEFDRASEEVEDDELQDKQPEDEILGVDKSVDMIREDISTPENESSLEVSPQILLSQLRIFDDESQGTLGDHTLTPMKPYQSFSQSWYELDTIQSDINFKALVAHECDMVGAVVIYEVATTFEKLAKTWKFKFKSNPERSKLLDDMFSFMEKSSEKYVMVWESHCRLLESQQELELSGWKYKKQINQGQICLNGLCNELVCDKEKKRDSIEFNECHIHLKKLQAALEGIPQKIAGGLIYGDVKFHLKHKWRSRLEFCVKTAILFTSSVRLLCPKNHKLLHYEAEFCAQYNDLKQLSTEFQSSLGLNFFTYLIFKWNQALNCGCEAGHTSSGFFSVGDVYGFFTCSKPQTGDETQEKRLLFLNNNNKVGHTIKENWFHSEPMIRGVYHLQRPPELIELQGNPNFITKVLVQWKEHPPDQFFSGSQWQEFNFSSLRTRMFRRGKYCDRIISKFPVLINRSLNSLNLSFITGSIIVKPSRAMHRTIYVSLFGHCRN